MYTTQGQRFTFVKTVQFRYGESWGAVRGAVDLDQSTCANVTFGTDEYMTGISGKYNLRNTTYLAKFTGYIYH